MDCSLIVGVVLVTLGIGLAAFPTLIQFSKHREWVDAPSLRRRHEASTPIGGGLGIQLILFAGLAIYSFCNQSWFLSHLSTIFVMGSALLAICAIGFVDDLRDLSPKLKLVLESLVAIFVLAFEPEIHHSLSNLIHALPQFMAPIVWVAGVLWIVGSTNALNLIDGIDGLAGSAAMLMLCTCLGLHYMTNGMAGAMPVMLALALPGLLAFLRSNWHPAKIFLGDNGSLSLGFLVACGAIVPMRPQDAITTTISYGIIMGLPILDMGLCVFRRRMKGYSIFKADRSHLHHRIQRLGLTTPQATTLLLFVCFYLQISATLIVFASSMVVALIAVSACAMMASTESYAAREVNRSSG